MIGIYEKALPANLSWAERLSKVMLAGYDYMEISIDETEERLGRLKSVSKKREILQAVEAEGISLLSMCLSGHRKYPLGSADSATERRALDIAFSAIDFSAELHVRIVQLAGYDAFYEPSTPGTARRFEDNLLRVVRYAEQVGVMLAIEPVDLYFINSVESAMRYVREINSPWLQIYPDMANLAAAGHDPCEQLALAKGHLVAVHFKDALKGIIRGVPFGAGIGNFEAVIATLRRCDFYGPIMLEMWDDNRGDYFKKISDARAFALKALDAGGKAAMLSDKRGNTEDKQRETDAQ